ncbi:LysR family transcriptional regulator [Millisia brevis]|uniref:LysR family transcriptional regulator n=1 Tax=Millisia brevis TaxID=264148 RepID=UPI0009FD1A0C|nr:LysR family transcriptional regulator [Millisia brevis]
MDIRQVEFFVAVADELNFTRAAGRVVAVQSTVSAGVSALEHELGVTLFERTTRRVALTAAGEELLPVARRMLAEADRMRDIGRLTRAGLRGRIRVGVITSIPFDVPGLLGRFHHNHPLVELGLSMSPRGSAGLIDDVRRGRVDVAWVGGAPQELVGVEATRLIAERYVVLVPSSHPLAAVGHPLEAAALADEPQIDMPRGFANREQVDRHYAELGMARRVVVEIPDLAQIPSYVAAGLGIAITQASAVPVAGVVAMPLADPLEWMLWVIASADRRSPAVDALLAAVRRMADQFPVGDRSSDPL